MSRTRRDRACHCVKFSRIQLLVAALIFAAPPLTAQSTAGNTPAALALPAAQDRMKERITRIADHVYEIHAPLGYGPTPLANEVLIEQSDGLVLVDAGKTRGAGMRIVALIRSVSSKPVKAVIVTHWHQDHVLGLGPIVEAWPNAEVISSTATRDAILADPSYRATPRHRDSTAVRDSARAAALAQYAVQYGPYLHDSTLSAGERAGWAEVVGVLSLRIADERGTYLVVPSRTFADRFRIDDALAPVEAISAGPAHTSGDAIVWMPRQRVAAAGDLMVVPIPYAAEHALEWPAALSKLRQLSPALIVPGHGPLQSNTEFLVKTRDALLEMQYRVLPLVAGPPLSDEQLVEQIDLTAMRSRFAKRDRWLAYWFDQYFAPNAAVVYNQFRALEK